MYEVDYSGVKFEGNMNDLSHVFCLRFEFRACVERSRCLVAATGILNDHLHHHSALQHCWKPTTSTAKDCSVQMHTKRKNWGRRGHSNWQNYLGSAP